jgi:hypothetical protein
MGPRQALDSSLIEQTVEGSSGPAIGITNENLLIVTGCPIQPLGHRLGDLLRSVVKDRGQAFDIDPVETTPL